MLDDYADPMASQRQIKDTEHKGDNQTHLIIRTLNKPSSHRLTGRISILLPQNWMTSLI